MDPRELKNVTSKEELVDFGIYYLDIVECPLDPNHKLRRHRLPYHLIKCKKSFPDKIQCPYGHYYYLDKHEIANHLQVCSHKPKTTQIEEMQTHLVPTKNNILYNYDVNKHEIEEPYWD